LASRVRSAACRVRARTSRTRSTEMVSFGYTLSSEEHAPRDLVNNAATTSIPG
jgi:hypothetical protein